MKNLEIVVTNRGYDYHAALRHNGMETNQWESGQTQAEAIGQLIISCKDILKIRITNFSLSIGVSRGRKQ